MRGFSGWRWIFIIEGALSVAVCLFFFFYFPSFPEEAAWLREDEREYVKARLRADQGRNAADRPISLRDVGCVMADPKVWLGGLMYFGLIVPAYGYAFFSPTIISTFNYSPIQTQLYSVPPYAVAFAFGLMIAFGSDRLRHRFLFVVGPICLSVTGFAVLLAVHDRTAVQYAALFLVCMGTFAAMPVIMCWFQMNLGGHHRRAVGTAWQIGFGNFGGILATYSFLASDAPFFRRGYGICLSLIVFGGLCCAVYAALVARENRKRDAAPGADAGLTEDEKTELGVSRRPSPLPAGVPGRVANARRAGSESRVSVYAVMARRAKGHCRGRWIGLEMCLGI